MVPYALKAAERCTAGTRQPLPGAAPRSLVQDTHTLYRVLPDANPGHVAEVTFPSCLQTLDTSQRTPVSPPLLCGTSLAISLQNPPNCSSGP